MAAALEKSLGQIIQAVESWISTDIEKGARWGPEIADRLERSRVGILCLTRENLESRWIAFEAGALSKTKNAYVCTLLIGITPADVEPPLSQFQATTTEKADILKLLGTINAEVAKVSERSLSDANLGEIFERYWPSIQDAFNEAASLQPDVTAPKRRQSDILDEILTTVRNVERKVMSDAAGAAAGARKTSIPNLDFTASPMAAVPNGYIFTPLEDPPDIITKWVWDFGDGTTRTVTGTAAQATTYVYATGGSHTVTLGGYDDTHGLLVQVSHVIGVAERNRPTRR